MEKCARSININIIPSIVTECASEIGRANTTRLCRGSVFLTSHTSDCVIPAPVLLLLGVFGVDVRKDSASSSTELVRPRENKAQARIESEEESL